MFLHCIVEPTKINKLGSLKQPLIIPFWMLIFQNVTDPVVFPEKDSAVEKQSGQQCKEIMSQGKEFGITWWREISWPCNVKANIFKIWWVFLTIENL